MPLSQSDRELTERSRFLQETLKYSGYYVVPSPSSTRLLQAHSLVSSAFSSSSDPSTATNTAADGTEAAPPVQQIYTPQLERYSDRYRKILGKKTFYDEIVSAQTAEEGPDPSSWRYALFARPACSPNAHSFRLALRCFSWLQPTPNPHLFPPELLSSKHQIRTLHCVVCAACGDVQTCMLWSLSAGAIR